MGDETKTVQQAQRPLKPVKLIFHKVNEVPMYHAYGAWGLAGQGKDLVLKFFTEYTKAPSEFVFPLDSTGVPSLTPTGAPQDKSEFYTVIREFQCGVTLSPVAMRQLYQLLHTVITDQDKAQDELQH